MSRRTLAALLLLATVAALFAALGPGLPPPGYEDAHVAELARQYDQQPPADSTRADSTAR